MSAPRACSFFFDAEPLGEPGTPALDACALCTKLLGRDNDIFMYRGDTPYCSEECRYEQIQFDAFRTRRAARRQTHSAARTKSWRGSQESAKVSGAS